MQCPAFAPTMLLVVAGMVVIPVGMIFSKAGYSKWLSVSMPLVNVITLYRLAFSSGPSLREHG